VDIAGDVLASITTMQWNGPAKGWNAGAPMDDANFNRRQTIRVGPSVSYAQAGVIGFDGPIDLQSLRLYGLPEAAPAVLNGTPLLPQSGQREFAAEVSWDLPSLAPGATSLIDVTVTGAWAGDLAQASLVSPSPPRWFIRPGTRCSRPCRLPPIATFISCSPRQIASTGVPRASAVLISGSVVASRAGSSCSPSGGGGPP